MYSSNGCSLKYTARTMSSLPKYSSNPTSKDRLSSPEAKQSTSPTNHCWDRVEPKEEQRRSDHGFEDRAVMLAPQMINYPWLTANTTSFWKCSSSVLIYPCTAWKRHKIFSRTKSQWVRLSRSNFSQDWIKLEMLRALMFSLHLVTSSKSTNNRQNSQIRKLRICQKIRLTSEKSMNNMSQMSPKPSFKEL